MKVRHFCIVGLILLNVYLTSGLLTVDIWMAVIAAYVLFGLPPAAGLFALAWSSRKKDSGWLKFLDNIGLLVSIVSVLAALSYFITDSIRFYSQ